MTLCRLGFVRPGYDGDLVIWNRHPLQVGATPLEVFIDGNSVARASDSLWKVSESRSYANEAPASRPNDVLDSTCKPGQSDIVVRGLSMSFISDDGQRSEQPQSGNLTVVVRAGRVVCVGETKCDDMAGKAVEDNVPTVDLRDGHMLPVTPTIRPNTIPRI